MAAACVVLMLLVALLRGHIGNQLTPPPLKVINTGINDPLFQPRAELLPVPQSFVGTLFGGVVWACRAAATMGVGGGLWLVVWLSLLLLIWHGLAVWGGWRRPPLPLAFLLLPQLFAVAHYGSWFLMPLWRISTPFTVADFVTHSTFSAGALTPEQQVQWHRIRRFSALSFASFELQPYVPLEKLQRENSDFLLLSGLTNLDRVVPITPVVTVTSDTKPIHLAPFDEHQNHGDANQAVLLLDPENHENWPADGLCCWNGGVTSPEAMKLARMNRWAGVAIVGEAGPGRETAAWTLLPRNLHNPQGVVRALWRHKTGVAWVRDLPGTAATKSELMHWQQSPFAPVNNLLLAWHFLTRAQHISAVLVLLALLSLLWFYAQRPQPHVELPVGPNRAVAFLKRRRLVARLRAALLMLLPALGTWLVLPLIVGSPAQVVVVDICRSLPPEPPAFYALLWCLLMDLLCWYGQTIWRSQN